jgi:hypothetical protein
MEFLDRELQMAVFGRSLGHLATLNYVPLRTGEIHHVVHISTTLGSTC